MSNKIGLAILPAIAVVAGGLVALRMHFQPPTVPAFALAGPGASGEVTLTHGAQFALDLRPEAPVSGAIAARTFLIRGDDVRAVLAPFTVTGDGAVHIEGAVDTLFDGVPDGAWDVAVAVGRPETLPVAPQDILRARDADPRELGWRLVRERVFLRT